MRIKLVEDREETVVATETAPMAAPGSGRPAEGQYRPTSLRVFREEAEVHAISLALEYAGWNRRRAAQLLRISYRGLLYKIRQYNITAASRDEIEPGRGLGEES
jgi:transcriptional regulator with PAS, ATPase and Fis domain